MRFFFLLLFILSCLFSFDAPIHLSEKNLNPSWNHFLGTDDLGRDLFNRLMDGCRVTFLVTLTAGSINLLIGSLFGMGAAFLGGWAGNCMIRFSDILWNTPHLLLAIALSLILGTGLVPVIFVISLTGWMKMARVVFAETLYLKNREFIVASYAMGGSFFHIIKVHLVPHALPVLASTALMTFRQAIFTETFLSFIGIGITPPLASWGSMTLEALPAMAFYPWRLAAPALLIGLTIATLNHWMDQWEKQC